MELKLCWKVYKRQNFIKIMISEWVGESGDIDDKIVDILVF